MQPQGDKPAHASPTDAKRLTLFALQPLVGPHAAIHPDRPRGAVPAPRRERVRSFLGHCSSLPFSSTPPPAQAGSAGRAAGALLRAARQPIPPRGRRAPTAIRAPGSTPAPARAPALPRRSWDLLIRRRVNAASISLKNSFACAGCARALSPSATARPYRQAAACRSSERQACALRLASAASSPRVLELVS